MFAEMEASVRVRGDLIFISTVIFYFVFNFVSLQGYIQPSISLTSCNHKTASLRISNTTTGGLLYIRTDTFYNVESTVDGEMTYDCAFEDCNIQWNEKFNIVVQRHVVYQSADDVDQWFVCSTDFNSIKAFSIEFGEGIEDNLTMHVQRPDAVIMSFVSGGKQVRFGSDVKLGTELNLLIHVINNDKGTFDIRPRECWTSSIPLYSNMCVLDSTLFGKFERIGPGTINNTFRMFRPTAMSGGPFEVIFTCVLQVCMYECAQPLCDGNAITNTNERRKRQESGSDPPSMVLGAMLRAYVDGELVVTEDIPSTPEICLSIWLLSVCVVVYASFFLASTAVLVVRFYKLFLHRKKLLTLRDGNSRMDPKTNSVVSVAIHGKSALNS